MHINCIATLWLFARCRCSSRLLSALDFFLAQNNTILVHSCLNFGVVSPQLRIGYMPIEEYIVVHGELNCWKPVHGFRGLPTGRSLGGIWWGSTPYSWPCLVVKKCVELTAWFFTWRCHPTNIVWVWNRSTIRQATLLRRYSTVQRVMCKVFLLRESRLQKIQICIAHDRLL